MLFSVTSHPKVVKKLIHEEKMAKNKREYHIAVNGESNHEATSILTNGNCW